MSDYRLDRLNTREFEHLSQSLCKKFIALGVTPFGDGPDGGREATFDGKMDYPSNVNPWDGYLVAQCKFRQRADASSDTDWVVAELSRELKKFRSLGDPGVGTGTTKHRRVPSYYLFVTNAVLTPASKGGGRDRSEEILRNEAARIGIKDFAIWGYDDICRFLDLSAEIRRTYSGFVLPDDVLQEAIRLLKIDEPDFNRVLSKFIQKELRSDYSAKLQSAGQHDLREISLASVFIDIPFTFDKDTAFRPSDSHPGLVGFMLDEGDRIIRSDELMVAERDGRPNKAHIGRYAIVGGPGQGKSTVGQYLCQLYRAELIKTLPPATVDPTVDAIVKGLLSTQTRSGRMPHCRRFPFRVVLNSFATDLEHDKTLTIIEYIRKRLLRLGAVKEISLNHLQKWISGYPWVFILDGLDEVPESSNRKEVLEAIEDFLVDLTANEADVLVVSTTRPQGYSGDFAKSFFRHIYLAPLSDAQALQYGSALLRSRAADDEDRFDQAYRRLQMAAQNSGTLRLMRSPLQVTIMATLVERLGDPPKQRYRLFAEYYRTIYEREVSREGALSRLLSDRKTDIDLIHHRVGFLLQTASENAGDTDATIRLKEFLELVRNRFESLGESPENVNRLASQIKTSTLERLVFLVSLQDEHVGFEIRSLQEFMAAEAIYKSDHPGVVVDRINEIASIDHWRNVLLFLVGKCFSEDNKSLLDRLLVLCDELNDAGPEYKAVRWGSQIALNVLLDGAARNYPKRERLLCKTTLELLDIPGAAFSTEIVSVYHPGLDDLFRSHISHSISHGGVSAIGAWRSLHGLAVKNIQWARDIFDQEWSTLSASDKSLVIDPGQTDSPWIIERILAIVPQISPAQTFRILGDGFFASKDRSESTAALNVPQWARPILFRSNEYWSILEAEYAKAPLRINGQPVRDGTTLQFRSVKANYDANDLYFSEMPVENTEWLPYKTVATFLKAPGKESLADALEMLACDGEMDVQIRNVTFWRSPWPLASLLAVSKTPVEMRKHAAMSRNGEFGDLEDWVSIEDNVVDQGVDLGHLLAGMGVVDDVLCNMKDCIPAICMIVNFQEFSDDLFKEMYLLWDSVQGKGRAIAAYLLLHAVSLTPSRRYEQSGRHSISAVKMCELISDAQSVMNVQDLNIFGRFTYDEGDSEACESLISCMFSEHTRAYNSHAFEMDGWFDRNIHEIIARRGKRRETIQWATWLGKSGGYPRFSEEDVAQCIRDGYLDEADRFWLKFGSQDFSFNDAKSAITHLEMAFKERNEGKEYELREQLMNSIDALPEVDRVYVCVKLQEFLAKSRFANFQLVPSVRIGHIIEQSLRLKKTGFYSNTEKLRQLELVDF